MTDAELDAVADVIAEVLRPIKAQLAALEATKGLAPTDLELLSRRVQLLEEQPRLSYRGVYDDTKTYHPGDIVTHRGSGWYCHEATRETPGAPSAAGRSWQLMIKAGRDGKDAQ